MNQNRPETDVGDKKKKERCVKEKEGDRQKGGYSERGKLSQRTKGESEHSAREEHTPATENYGYGEKKKKKTPIGSERAAEKKLILSKEPTGQKRKVRILSRRGSSSEKKMTPQPQGREAGHKRGRCNSE